TRREVRRLIQRLLYRFASQEQHEERGESDCADHRRRKRHAGNMARRLANSTGPASNGMLSAPKQARDLWSGFRLSTCPVPGWLCPRSWLSSVATATVSPASAPPPRTSRASRFRDCVTSRWHRSNKKPAASVRLASDCAGPHLKVGD